MKRTGLISGKVHDPGRLFTRVPRARFALVTGFAVLALLGCAAVTVQASTTPSAAAYGVMAKAVTALRPGSGVTAAAVSCDGGAAIDDWHNGSPLYSYIPGDGNVNLYFDNSGAATRFCTVNAVNSPGRLPVQFYVNGTSVCLALDAPARSIHEGSATACSDQASYTVWELYATPSAYSLYKSLYNGDCIYDNTQRPVTYAACSTSNEFEWLTIP